MSERAGPAAMVFCAAVALLVPTAPRAEEKVWAASYEAATQTRYIPLELILGAEWDGSRTIAFPAGSFTEGVPRDPSTWYGPGAWRHPDTGKTLQVYERRRRGVAQKFAVRDDGAAIGRVADTRFGMRSCDQEAKYPLGYWRQGQSRRFDFRCWYGGGAERTLSATITIEQIDYAFAGHEHALRMRWTLTRAEDGKLLDDRVYVFAPLRGAVLVQ